MPLTKKGKKIMAAMKAEYGDKKGESVFYASANKGKIGGVHHSTAQNVQSFEDRAVFSEAPPKTGNPNAASVTAYTNPRNPGSAKATVMEPGTASPRETLRVRGPGEYNKPPIMGNSGPIRHTGKWTPANVDTFGDGTEVDLAPSYTRGIAKIKDTDSTDVGSSNPSA